LCQPRFSAGCITKTAWKRRLRDAELIFCGGQVVVTVAQRGNVFWWVLGNDSLLLFIIGLIASQLLVLQLSEMKGNAAKLFLGGPERI